MPNELDNARRELAEAALNTIIGEFRNPSMLPVEPIAAAFEKIGRALHAGVDPMEVAVTCFAAAAALLNPEDHDEIQRSAESTIKDMQRDA